MESIRNSVLAHLTELQWRFEERDSFVAAPVSAANGTWTVQFFMPPGSDQLIIHSLLPLDVPPHELVNVACFLTMANFGLSVGNFEMDLSDGPRGGEVRYKTSIDAQGAHLPTPIVRNLLDANIRTADRYLPGLQRAVVGHPAASCIAAIDG